MIPETLHRAIEKELSPFSLQELTEASAQLSGYYRCSKPTSAPMISSALQRASYLAVRMPATFAAVHTVFEEIHALMPQIPIRSVLDLGSGPGTALWAAAEVFPELEKVTLIENNPKLIEIGKRMAEESTHPALRHAQWVQGDLIDLPDAAPHDLVVFSYSLGELGKDVERIHTAYWKKASHAIACIEPGTPRGFQTILAIRTFLINAGAHLIAPCPHACTCPMPANDWCHFSKRLQRTREHRLIKGGELGFEDEKFSYVVGGTTKGLEYSSRILRHPEHHSGHTKLTLCTANGVVKQVVSRKHKEAYRRARKAEWGDQWNKE